MKPSKIEFHIGEDSYGRKVVLSFEMDYQNKENVTIKSHAASQRDDTTTITSLTKENIKLAFEAIQSLKS